MSTKGSLSSQARSLFQACDVCIVLVMPRTDTNGRSLASLLNYVLDGVGAQDIQQALGVSAPTYYRRKVQEDYPNAEELRLIARYFGMNFVSLLSVFGLLEGDDHTTEGEAVPPLALLTRQKPKAKQLKNVDLEGPAL
jgi:hypothetical protein